MRAGIFAGLESGPAVFGLKSAFLKPEFPDLKPTVTLRYFPDISRPVKDPFAPDPKFGRLLKFRLIALDRP